MDRPKPLTPDRRFPLWIGFLLGMAGVLVTIAGIYEFVRRQPTVLAVPHPLEAENARLRAELERVQAPGRDLAELQEAERRAKMADIRRKREAAAKAANEAEVRLRQDASGEAWTGRCIDGTLILKRGSEIRSAGRCR